MTSSPSLLNPPPQAWQRSTAQLPTHPSGTPSSPSLIIITRVEETCIFAEGAGPFKHYSVVIICSLSLSSQVFSTHRVPDPNTGTVCVCR